MYLFHLLIIYKALIIYGKLQIIHLKFKSDWILHFKILEFRFYLLKFGDIWI